MNNDTYNDEMKRKYFDTFNHITNKPDNQQTVAIALDQFERQLRQLYQFMIQNNAIIELAVVGDGKSVMKEYMPVLSDLRQMEEAINSWVEYSHGNCELAIARLSILTEN